jgi:PIN domain nuclease of toxin-antitoxin system
VILLDTHVLVWLDEASPRLGADAIVRIDTAFQAGEVAVSAISFWEVAMLVGKGRIRLNMDLSVWRNDLIEQGVIELPVTGEIGIKAAGLESFHGDPADRLIAATALQHSLTLLTADEKLLSCKLAVKRQNASN